MRGGKRLANSCLRTLPGTFRSMNIDRIEESSSLVDRLHLLAETRILSFDYRPG